MAEEAMRVRPPAPHTNTHTHTHTENGKTEDIEDNAEDGKWPTSTASQ